MGAKIEMGVREIVLQDLLRQNGRLAGSLWKLAATEFLNACHIWFVPSWEECFKELWLDWAKRN